MVKKDCTEVLLKIAPLEILKTFHEYIFAGLYFMLHGGSSYNEK